MQFSTFTALLQRLSGKAILFFFFHSLLFLGLFFIGNYQEFLEANQLMLLGLFEISAAITLTSGLYYLSVSILNGLIGQRISVLRLSGTLAIMVICAGVLIAFKFLNAWIAH